MNIKENITKINYQDPFAFYKTVANIGNHPSLLFESLSQNGAYAKSNLVAATQAFKVSGKNESFKIEALSDVGGVLLSYLKKSDFSYAKVLKINSDSIEGIVKRDLSSDLTEFERIRRPNISLAIRTVLDTLKKEIGYEHAGLYGAFAYDFARNFENFGDRFSQGGTDDFNLYFPSNIFYLDGKKETAERFQLEIDGKKDELESVKKPNFTALPFKEFEDMSLDEYAQKVEQIIDQIKNGRLMQCVLSRNYGQSLQKHPLDSYAQLREINPSPYCFFMDFNEGQFLYGASPELHVKIKGKSIQIRPLAGTIKKGKNAVENFIARQTLINDKKELAEHTILVDLAINDVSRLSLRESVNTTDYATIEEYPNLYHLASGVSGILREGVDSIDAILTTLPAGTLSGGSKNEAMKAIEELENSRRNFYGGVIGNLLLNGDCNTGITIRSIHVNDGMSYVRSGAGVVLHSVPENEVKEILIKSEKAKQVLK